MNRAAETGLVFNTGSVPEAADAATGRIHNSRSGLFKYLPRFDRTVGRYASEAVHETVRTRVGASDYWPKGLRESRFWAELSSGSQGGDDGAD